MTCNIALRNCRCQPSGRGTVGRDQLEAAGRATLGSMQALPPLSLAGMAGSRVLVSADARLRGRPADRAPGRARPGLAGPQGGRLPGHRPAARRRPDRPREHRARPGPPAHHICRHARRREAARRWLHTPVEHVREIRSHLLLKLALLDRVGGDPTDLLRDQRAVLEPIAPAIEDQRASARLRRHPARLAPRDRGGRPGLPRHDHGNRRGALEADGDREEAVRRVVDRPSAASPWPPSTG